MYNKAVVSKQIVMINLLSLTFSMIKDIDIQFHFSYMVLPLLQENFERQIQPQKESQSFSLIYDNSQRSLDLVSL